MNAITTPTHTQDYERVAAAIAFLSDHFREQPDLAAVADHVHLSKHHFHRLFKRWAGITPAQFQQYLTVEYAKQRLAADASVLETALEAGLSGPGRLHDLFVTFEALSPGEYKRLGAALTIRYGIQETPFGETLLAVTPRGICALRFVAAGEGPQALAALRAEWPGATLVEDPAATAPLLEAIFSRRGAGRPFHLLLRGTNFQVQVWRALLRIPAGALVSYQSVADYLGRPGAARAVAGAIARNPVGFLIPCHRVISSAGAVHGYRWDPLRKQAIIAWEAGARS